MAALKFISEIVAPGSRVLITNTHQPLSAAVLRQLQSVKHLIVTPITNPNQQNFPVEKFDLVLHFAGFEPPSLAQTFHLTSTLHKLMDYALQTQAKFILVLPEVETAENQTALSLVRQFGKNFDLDYLVITVPATDHSEDIAELVIQAFIKGYQRQSTAATPPLLTKPTQHKSKKWLWLILPILLYGFSWMLWGLLTFGSLHFLYQGQLSHAVSWSQLAQTLTPLGANTTVLRLAESVTLVAQFGQQPLTTPLAHLSELLAEDQANSSTLLTKIGVISDLIRLRQFLANLELIQPDIVNFLASPQQTWLVLLQDSQQLRPTGGYLSAFAVVNLESGRVTHIQLYDTASTDGLFRGQASPPADLALATHQSSWWMRDSNWDPNFPDTATRAAWFVNKELVLQVDGVVSVNSTLIKALLKATGPISVNGINNLVTESNLNQQNLDDSYKNLTQALLTKMNDLPSSSKIQIWKIIAEQLATRQLALTWLTSPNQLGRTGWDGGLTQPACKDCIADLVYVVDSNVGENKANAMVQPAYHLAKQVNNSQITYDYSLTYINPPGSPGDYQNYVRLLVSPEQKVDEVRVNGELLAASDFQISLQSGLNQMGTLIAVPVGSTTTVEIKTHRQLPMAAPAHYSLIWLNQPGQPALPLTIATAGQLQYNGPLAAPVKLWSSLF